MKLGEVYLWESEKVEGHDQRRKYHIFICPQDEDGDHTFLYINSVDWFKDFKLLQSSYDFLTYDSFVGCNAIVTYNDQEIALLSMQCVGQITQADLKGIRDAIIAAETMERQHSNRVCGALVAAL